MQSTAALDQHRKVLAILYLGFGALWAILGLVVLGVFVIGAVPAGSGRDRTLLLLLGIAITLLLLLMAAVGIIGGIGMLQRRAWSKAPIVLAAALSLLHFPVGTLLGIYTLWFWFQPRTGQIFFPQTSEPQGPLPGGPGIQRPLTT
jgi:hypothetical protein